MGLDWQTEPAVDAALLAAAASNFAGYPGVLSDASAKEFLDQFPLPLIFSTLERVLQQDEDVPGLESAVVDALERIFKTNYGATLLVYAMPYANLGLTATSPLVRRLACFAISRLLEQSKVDGGAAIQAVASAGLAQPLMMALADRDDAVAAAAAEALLQLTKFPEGLELLFTDKGAGAGSLKQMALSGSALVRIRALSVAEKMFGISEAAAYAIQQSGVLDVLAMELDNGDDILAQMNALELLHQLSLTVSGIQFLCGGNLIERFTSTIRDPTVDPLIRARAISVGARLVSNAARSPVVEPGYSKGLMQAIDDNMERLKAIESTSTEVANEQETVLDSLGEIGAHSEGAELLLSGPRPTARLIIDAAFKGRQGIQLAGVHALASLLGTERTETPLLSEQGENSFRNLIYEATSGSSQTPSGSVWSLVQQAPDLRIATYRLITVLVARVWWLRELSSHTQLVDLVADAHTETLKEGMDWRHAACVAMSSALTAAVQRGEPFPVEILDKMDTAVRRGPYFAREQVEARPIVVTQERF